MRKLLPLMVLGLLFGCASSPSMPTYETSKGKECATECQKDHSDCMELDVRPDYLLMSPRKRACNDMLNECYHSCLVKEKKQLRSTNP